MKKTYKIRVLESLDSKKDLILWVKAESIFDARKLSKYPDNMILSVVRVNAKTGQPIKTK